MRKATRKEELKFLKKWFDKFDRHFFDGYFEDKHTKIKIRNLDVLTIGRVSDIVAYADDEANEIAISTKAFKEFDSHDLRETILHEMIHLFVRYTYPNGKRVWGDGCQAFRHCEKKLQRLRVKQIERKYKKK